MIPSPKFNPRMRIMKPCSPLLLSILLLTVIPLQFPARAAVRIVVVAGETATVDKVGHHDYLGGCRMLTDVLKQTAGVETALVRDGWLNRLQFVEDLTGVTPLVWSGKTHQGSPDGGLGDVVGWVYERPAGGRSFGFTGIDAHAAWALPGMRQLVVNGILWTANLEIPNGGAPNKITEAVLDSYLTPR